MADRTVLNPSTISHRREIASYQEVAAEYHDSPISSGSYSEAFVINVSGYSKHSLYCYNRSASVNLSIDIQAAPLTNDGSVPATGDYCSIDGGPRTITTSSNYYFGIANIDYGWIRVLIRSAGAATVDHASFGYFGSR